MTVTHWLLISGIILLASILVIIKLIADRFTQRNTKQRDDLGRYFFEEFNETDRTIRQKKNITNYTLITRSVRLDKLRKEMLKEQFDMDGAEKKYLRELKLPSKTKRTEAAFYLSVIATDRARTALEAAIGKEKDVIVRLFMANALSDIGNPNSLPYIVDSLIGSKRFYREKVNMLIADFGETFQDYLPNIMDSRRIEFKELIVDFAAIFPSEELKNYLIQIVLNRHGEIQMLNSYYGSIKNPACKNCKYGRYQLNHAVIECKFHNEVAPTHRCKDYQVLPVSIDLEEQYNMLVNKACQILAEYFPKVLSDKQFLESDDLAIRNIAIRSLANFHEPENLSMLFAFLKNQDTARSARNAISKLIETNPAYIKIVLERFKQEDDLLAKDEMAKILSLRVEYFIAQLSKKARGDAKEIIQGILMSGRSSEVIDFLSWNGDIDTENELISILNKVIPNNPKIGEECRHQLDARILKKLKLEPIVNMEPEQVHYKDKKFIKELIIMLVVGVGIFPVLFSLKYKGAIFGWSLIEIVKLYMIDFSRYFAFYALAINLVYFVLLILSYWEVKKQERLWGIKDKALLFKKKMLPSVSIIAPAYNEEKTIIESANSLINLNYPKYELILVNDGSKDQTLHRLIQYYNLKRVDYYYDSKIATKGVRGVYLNRARPNLIVVDKENGGKADALNVGINIAKNDYVCGVDSDSLLEEGALLKLAALTLDESVETPALGGNILPVNGSTVEGGQIKDIRIPKGKLARFQTIEYIRAFMAGRLGWAKVNGLLIISGAFGLFRKARVIDVGGYLTSSGKYQKDTVGEDMEIVVRIRRQMKEKNREFKIGYAYNANCWTEVPESLTILKKQRFRWHRGLTEILSFHKKMLFNPKYTSTGLLALPYFFIFELIGPIIEIQGLTIAVLAFFLGLLNIKTAVILFVAIILMGVLVSVSSLLISEKNNQYFSLKELLILIGYAILENFGMKQYFNFLRVTAYFKMLKRPKGWEKAERKGFTSSEQVLN